MRSALRKVRRGLQTAAHGLGVTSLVAASRWRRARLLILCYHGVSLRDEHEWDSGLYVTETFLRARFDLLKRESYNVLPLDEAFRRLQQGMLPDRSIVLTFDDAMYDFHARALPLLEEFGFPATVYVPTYHVRRQRPIPLLAARYMAWRALRQGGGRATWRQRAFGPADIGDGGWVQREMVSTVRAHVEDHEALEAWMRELSRDLGVDWDEFSRERLFHLMTEAELADAAKRGVDMQLHTHRHRTPRDKKLFMQEIEQNRHHLREMLGQDADHFCYPSGDFDPMFFPWMRELRIRTATTCEPGISTRESSPLLLPRFIDTMSQPEATFQCWISGVARFVR